MKIETPQILWHNGSDGDGKPAPLYSISFLPSLDAHAHAPVVTATSATQGLVESTNAATAAAVATAATAATTIDNSDTEILATAGNCNEIHIWKLKLSACHSSSNSTEEPPSKKTKRSSNGNANANANANANTAATRTAMKSDTPQAPVQLPTQVQAQAQAVSKLNKNAIPKPKARSLPTTMSLTTPWARKFILTRPKDALLPIPREFLADGFNLVQLAPVVERAVAAMRLRGEDDGGTHNFNGNTNENANGNANQKDRENSNAEGMPSPGPSLYKSAIRLILEVDQGKRASSESTHTTSPPSSKYTPFQIQKAAEVLYTLVHARYVTSPRGLDTIRRMFKRNNEVTCEAIFGRCPRTTCNGMPLLPYGMSDTYDVGGIGGAGRKAMRYCQSCGEALYMWESKIDGSAWGSSFAHLFLMAHGSTVFPTTIMMMQSLKKSQVASTPTPKVFGFRIHPAADMNFHRSGI